MTSSSHSGRWPIEFDGIVEAVVATRQSDGPWNLAALGLRAGSPVEARTWGRTRTRRNFRRDGSGIVQFVDDPVVFVDAALGIRERPDPIDPSAAAWVTVDVEAVDRGRRAGTEWVDWVVRPRDPRIRRRSVPRINRGFGAVVEASVLASRLGVDGYDDRTLHDRIQWLGDVVDRCGGESERAAFTRIDELTDLELGRSDR